jgi:hypothetical protein
MEAGLESMEPTALDVESMAVYEEVFKEEKTVGTLKKWHRDRHLAIRHRGQLNRPRAMVGPIISWPPPA